MTTTSSSSSAPSVRPIEWAAEQLSIGVSTAYRLASAGKLPGALKVGGAWRISVPRFDAEVHGGDVGHVTDAPTRG